MDILPYSHDMAPQNKKHPFPFPKSLISWQEALLSVICLLLSRNTFILSTAPFGVAMLAAASRRKSSIWTVLCCFVGILSLDIGVMSVKYLLAAGLCAIAVWVLPRRPVISALSAAGSILVGALIWSAIMPSGLFSITVAFFEAILCGVFVMFFSLALPFLTRQSSSMLTKEEAMSICVILALSISGIGGLPFPLEIGIKGTLCVFFTMLAALKIGVGSACCVGVTLAAAISSGMAYMSYVISAYAFCGLVSGVFAGYKKLGVILAFMLGNAAISIYIGDSGSMMIGFYEIAIAGGILLIIPDPLLTKLSKSFTLAEQGELPSEYINHLKKGLDTKLKGLSKTFNELSASFEREDKSILPTPRDLADIIDTAANNACKHCSLCFACWQREFVSSYDAMSKMVEKADKKGWLEVSDAPAYFAEKCVSISHVVAELNRAHQLCKSGIVVENRLSESRDLVSRQLKGMAEIIDGYSNQVKDTVVFNEDTPARIATALEAYGVQADEVGLFKKRDGGLKIKITMNLSASNREVVRDIPAILEKVTDKRFEEQGYPRASLSRRSCSMTYYEKALYSIETGAARVKKEGQSEYGDSFSFIKPSEGNFVAALSDGMGSGRRAAKYSGTTVRLLKQLLNVGFPVMSAISLVNSALVLKSGCESFATVDMAVVDLYTANSELIKIGGAPSFLIRQDEVEVISSSSLPVGILKNLDAEKREMSLKDGDVLVLVSDGISEAEIPPLREEWLKTEISKRKSLSPQTFAEELLKSALKKRGGAQDDMTVVVLKLLSA